MNVSIVNICVVLLFSLLSVPFILDDFILEPVMSETGLESDGRGSVREVRLPLGLYHDRLHNVYIAAGTLGAAIAIVGVVVTYFSHWYHPWPLMWYSA